MPAINNDPLCGHYIRNFFVPAVEFYTRVVLDKVFPALDDEVISKEAHQVERKALEQTAAHEDDDDPSAFYDAAFNEGLEFYMSMRNTRQGLINALAVGLYHLFEQQLCEFCRLLAREPEAELDGEKAKTKLKDLGIDVKKLSDWSSIDDLRLLANCVKHAEGKSRKKLYQRRPDLFFPPNQTEAELNDPAWMEILTLSSQSFIRTPLSGEGVYFTVKEFKEKSRLLEKFWLDIAEMMSQ